MRINKKTLLNAIKLGTKMLKADVTKDRFRVGFLQHSVVLSCGNFQLGFPASGDLVDGPPVYVELDWVKMALDITSDEEIEITKSDVDAKNPTLHFGSHSNKEGVIMSPHVVNSDSLVQTEVSIKDLKRVQKWMSGDGARPNLTCVFVDQDKYIATDGHTLACVKSLKKEVETSYLILPYLVEAMVQAYSAKLFMQGNNARVVELVVKGDSFTVFAYERSEDKGRFPDFRQVLPQSQSLNMKVLPSMVKETKALHNQFKKLKLKSCHVRISYSEGLVRGKSFNENLELDLPVNGLEVIGDVGTPVTIGMNYDYFFDRLFTYLDPDTLAAGDYIYGVTDSLSPVTVSSFDDVFVVMPMRL